jgi:hypothetical protein
VVILLRSKITPLVVALAICVGLRAANADTFAKPDQSVSGSLPANEIDASAVESSAATAGVFVSASDSEMRRWDVIAESLFLWRDNHAPYWVAGDFDMGVGPRVIVTRNIDEEWGWEAEYFGVFGMKAGATQSGTFESFVYGLTEFGDNAQTAPVLYQTLQTYKSNLNNVELNAVRKWQSISLLAGFRYMRFDEQYRTDALATMSDPSLLPVFDRKDVTFRWANIFRLANTTYTTIDSAENNLIGGQLGLGWRQDAGRVFCEATGKAGIFGNVYKISDEPTKSNTAFIGDLNFSAGLHVNDIWSIRAGYNLLWITDVALAPRQVLTSIMFPTPFDPDNRVFLHGANVGLEAVW